MVYVAEPFLASLRVPCSVGRSNRVRGTLGPALRTQNGQRIARTRWFCPPSLSIVRRIGREIERRESEMKRERALDECCIRDYRCNTLAFRHARRGRATHW